MMQSVELADTADNAASPMNRNSVDTRTQVAAQLLNTTIILQRLNIRKQREISLEVME